MKTPTQMPHNEELERTFDQMRENLRPEILDNVMDQGFRDAMIDEYQALATATSELLKLIGSNNFAGSLPEEGVSLYENILARLSVSGQRCRVLIEESQSIDEQALLAITPMQQHAVN